MLHNFTGKLDTFARRIKGALGIRTEYPYKDFKILLPSDHQLPTYQHMYRLYDRFLPFLAKHISPGSSVVDVGANCGDTLAAMVCANSSLRYICIEADRSFFLLLEENKNRIKEAHHGATIILHRALVGKDVGNVALEGSGGTKRAIAVPQGFTDDPSLRPLTLDSLLADGSAENVRLLKSDVDGYDFDVLDSAAEVIGAHSPLLFFECDFRDDRQKDGYIRTILWLQSKGYVWWTIFDNFGAIVMHTSCMDTVMQLLSYVWKQTLGRATRTIYYLDVLASTPRDADLVSLVLDEYGRL